MPQSISVEVTGIDELLASLQKLSPDQSKEILSASLLKCAFLVQANAQTHQIIAGGPNGVVHPTKLTSRRGGSGLVGSISVDRSPLPFAIDVGTHLKYGAVHELGYSGPVTIKQHIRRITQAFGKPIKPRDVTVHAHSRIKVTYPPRPFLKPAAEAEESKFPDIFLNEWRRVSGE